MEKPDWQPRRRAPEDFDRSTTVHQNELNIKFLALVAAPEGVEVFFKAHPNIDLYVASVDEKLDKNAYIVPGLGDAGDRNFRHALIF